MLKKTSRLHIEGVAKASTKLDEGDVMVIYGHNNDIYALLKNE
jgi:hypothetical protein